MFLSAQAVLNTANAFEIQNRKIKNIFVSIDDTQFFQKAKKYSGT